MSDTEQPAVLDNPAITYTAYCVHCLRMTVWLLVAVVAGKQFYKCTR